MIWYEKQDNINGHDVYLEGTYKDSTVKIIAHVETNGEWSEHVLYEKTINMWAYQEVLAEDVLNKYRGMISKAEKKLSFLVEKHNIDKSI